MAKKPKADRGTIERGKVNNLSVAGTGWEDAPHPPGFPNLASQQLCVHIDDAAYVVRADVAPGVFAAMTSLLIAAAQRRYYVNAAWFQPSDPKATRVLTALQIQDFAERW